MADQQIVTSIVAKSDFSDLIADVQRVTTSLSKLQQEFAGSNRALSGQIAATNAMFKETMLKTGQFSSHFVSLTSDVEKFGRNLDSGRLKLRDYFRVYQDHVRTSGGLVRDLAKQQVMLQNAVLQPLGKNAQGLMQYNVHIPRGLDATANKAALLKQELQVMNKVIQDGGVQLINWGKNTQWAGRQLTVGLTLPLVAFGKAAADAFKVADQELTRLTKVYGDVAGTSSAELKRVREEVAATAKELSASMGVNFTETISLAADIAATGKTGNELLSSVSETTRLAVLGEVDRQEAMKATLAIQSAFKQNTEQLSESINFLNAVENQTSTSLTDLVEAIPKAGPVVQGLGGSVKDLALYLTAMKEGGINASEGANALKSALASLINPTDVAVKKFKSLGIDLLGIVNDNAGNVTETLFALQAALDKLNPLQKQQAIEQLFGKFQFSRLNALFENLGRQGSQTLQVLDLMKASTSQLAGVANRELAAVTESASGRFKRATETLKADMAGVGDQFLDVATKLVTILNKVLDFAQKLPDPVKKLLAFGGAFTAIIGPVIMLTGVLANFFGYIVKGLGHFKALFKGAEGFRLLTPELIAAQHAGAQLNDQFYNDALAADTLRVAIKRLSEDLIGLQNNAISAKAAAAGLGQTLSTSAGTPLVNVGGGRVVDPSHPLLGPRSRAAAHLNPRNPNEPSTIFGLTMQPIPVNRRIGANPQILMNDRLEDVEGLTTIGGVSTGVVAGEHARYQALMATLGLQSKKEIQELKKTIAMGGSVSADFISTFDDILPITQKLTQNAATQSAAIVAELRAGKINVEQARAAIIAVNAQLERDLGIQVTQYGRSVGRTIDLTKAPLIDQPVVDATGKPNVRGMFRQGIFAKVMSALGRATRTKTLGGSYSIETTKPTGFNRGGTVYMSGGGNIVPGPNVNRDVVPAVLTPGEFVVNRDATAKNLPLLQAINSGGSRGPGYNQGTLNPLSGLQRGHISNDLSAFLMYMDTDVNQRMVRGRMYQGYNGITGLEIANSLETLQSRTGMHPAAILRNIAYEMGGDPREVDRFYSNLINDLRSRENASRVFGGTVGESFEDFADRRLAGLRSVVLPNGNNLHDELRRVKTIRNGRTIGLEMDGRPYGNSNVLNVDASRRLPRQSSAIGRALLGTRGGFRGAQILRLLASARGFNSGGLVPGYNLGGMVAQTLVGFGGSMIGQQVGQRVAGDVGGTAGNILGFMLPSLLAGGRRQPDISAMYDKSIVSGTKFAQNMAGQAMMGGRLTSTLGKLALGITKTNLALGVGTAAVFAAYKMWKNYQDQLQATRQSFGLSADSASRLGLKYTDYNQKIKATIGATKALIDRNRALVESVTSANAPFKITVAEYKKLSTEVKSTMQNEIDMINKTKNSKLGDVAAQLKTQFVAAGMSAEEASKKIYMAFQLSEKSQFGYKSTLGNKDFSSIIDARSAAVSGVKQFNVARDFGDATAQANALNTALTAIDSGISEIIKNSEDLAKKDKTNKTQAISSYEAEKQMLDEIKNKVGSQKTLSKELLDELKKQNPEIRKFASTQDTVVSLFQKMRIAALGFTGDLSRMSATVVDALYKIAAAVNSSVESYSKNDILSKEYKKLTSLKNARDAAAKAAAGQSVKEQISARDALKLLDAKIKKIYEEAEARKKALREEQQDEDVKLQIQQKQLEYQDKIALGDTSGAAQAQLEMQKLVNEQQLTLTERAIDEAAKKKAAPLESQKAALEKSQQDLADAASLATDNLKSYDSQITVLQDKIKGFNDAMTAYALAAQTGEGDLKALWLAVQEAAKNIGITTGDLYKKFGIEKPKGADLAPHDQAMTGIVTPAQVDTQKLLDKLGIKANTVIIEAQNVLDKNKPGTVANPFKGGRSNDAGIDLGGWNTTWGVASTRQKVKKFAEEQGYKPGDYFTLTTGNQKDNTLQTWTFRVEKDNNITNVSRKATGGLLKGPGTGTSDSILGMYANGGMVRVSNGEYIINADTVSRLGVPFFDRINNMKSGGLMLNYKMPKYDNGGSLINAMAYNPSASAASNNALYNINVTLNGSNMNPDDVAKAISREMKMREAMSGRIRTVGA